ncbi:MAG: hypothetical protein AB1331_03815 [Bacillota bacterium]
MLIIHLAAFTGRGHVHWHRDPRHSVIAGHGPGVTSLFTSKTGKIEPVIDPTADIAYLMGLRDYPLESRPLRLSG